MVSDLMRDFAIGGGMLGVLSALYFYPYVLLQVPLGALLERLGARLLLFFALSIAGLGSFLFGIAESLPVAYAGRILIGIGSSVGFLGALALASRWFPQHMFALLTGLVMFFGMMSGVLGQAPLALFVETFGWRTSQWMLGAFGIGLALVVLLVVRNAPGDDPSVDKVPVQSWTSIWTNLKKALSLWNTWKIALIAAAMSGPMLALAGLWGVPYVVQTYGLSRSEAAFFVSLLLVGWAVGAPISGWISDKLQKRKAMLITGCTILSIALALIVFVPHLPLGMLIALFVITGISGSGMVATFALVRQTSSAEIGGSATGIVNALTVASGALLQPVVGFLLDLRWDGKMEAGSRIYQTSDYQFAFVVIFVSALLGLVLALTIKE